MINRNNREPERAATSVRVKPLDILEFVRRIESEPGFSFARISDGGFFCILGRKGVNCDGAAYSSAQAEALISMMKDTTITHGITSIALHVTKAAEWLEEKNLVVDWYDADVMNKASDVGRLLPFIECLRKRKIIFCGPEHLRLVAGFPVQKFVRCHPTQAFEEVGDLELELEWEIKAYDADTVLLSAGQGASPTLVSRLHVIYPNINIIDTGSIFDPYVHVFSRSGHKKRGWEEYKRLGWKNFNENVESWV
jgi:hypothetical protein